LNGETEAVELLKAVKYDFDRHIVPASTEDLSQRLEPLSIGLSHQCPVLGVDARMFRIRPMAKKPTLISDVGEPPPEKSPIGRLNEKGQSVLKPDIE